MLFEHLKEHATKQLAVNRDVFDRVKGCYFTLPLRSMLSKYVIEFSLRP